MSLTTRAILAILLMVGFYALSVAVVAALLFIPYAEWTYLDRIDFRLAIGCIVGAGLILYYGTAEGPYASGRPKPDL